MAKRTSAGSQRPQRTGLTDSLLEEYLQKIKDTHSSGAGVPEVSFYPALDRLFNGVGSSLRPRVTCVMNLKQLGAGLPDGGLFTADQLQRQEKSTTQPPSRGAIEVKPPNTNLSKVAATPQVVGYVKRYRIVIVTNLRGFLIVGSDPNNNPVEQESFSLADDEETFWRQIVAHPRSSAQRHGSEFMEFIKRACLHAAPLVSPKDVAWFLASYARDALARVERHKELPALQAVRTALEQALGMKFIAEKGEHFFRSTLVQTIFYGVFSAWVLWHRGKPGAKAKFDWRTAEWSLHVPFIRTLYEELAKATSLGRLQLVEVLDWTAGVLNRVDRAEFFEGFQDEHAVQYFYEPFLEAYDPQLRKELGVWYTPPEIVKYQVARVDTVLREELDLPDGLADPNVIVLDPCCGTGAYLVETLHRIAKTLRDRGGDALVASDLKQAAMHRVFGFEILPAPFVVSHLQLGILLQNEGVLLSHPKGERVGVYLTNALTGWEPPKGVKATLPLFPELEEERDAAEQVKRKQKILVVLGNPPYNAFAGVSPEEEQGLVEPYKKDLNKPISGGGWGIKKFNLDDLYVRFFRLAERRIAEMTGKGVVSFISNFSYLRDPSFVVMRQRFLGEFDKLWFDCMNGDSRETGKLTPEGLPDPSVFSTEFNREGIRVGTAVSIIVRKSKRPKKPVTRFRHFWGVDKRAELLESLKKKRFEAAYVRANPAADNRFTFYPENVAEHYNEWPKLTDLCAMAPSNGLMEKRGGALIDIDRAALEARMRDYVNRDISWEEYKTKQTALTHDAAAFDAKAARVKALQTDAFEPDRLCRYALRPFDTRWCYYTSVNPVWNRARPMLWAQFWKGNQFFVTRFRSSADREGPSVALTQALLDDHFIVPDAVAIPMRIRNGRRLTKNQQATLFDMLGEPPEEEKPIANFSWAAREYMRRLRIHDPDANENAAALIWMHALAIGYSPDYLTENADGIRRDWPRLPLPSTRKSLEASATPDNQLAALLDTETQVPAVTTGNIAPALRVIGPPSKLGHAPIDPAGRDLAITAGWGHAGKDGVTMPGKGKLAERRYNAEEAAAIDAEAQARGLDTKDVIRLLGEKTFDVYLNETAYWRNVPQNVWDYYIGGYQVIKKWLCYREEKLLGRPITPEEAREVTNMIRRIAAIILLQPQLNENYQRIKEAPFDWSTLANAMKPSAPRCR